MHTPRDAQSQGYVAHATALSDFAAMTPNGSEVPAIAGHGSRAVEAWFLGPKGENAELLERLVVDSIRDQVYWRRNFHPGDPSHIPESVKRSASYLEAVDALRDGADALRAFLKKSAPFFSMRYQGHMNWDLVLPGVIGYFTALLYNPNNVAFEGSTATTILELLVGDDLCQMLQLFPAKGSPEAAAGMRPWGHVTCDGTVANIEALWSARNLKYLPLALADAVAHDAPLQDARGVEVALSNGSTACLTDLDPWALLNLPADTTLALPGRVAALLRSMPADGVAQVTRALASRSLQTLGWAEFAERYLKGVRPGVVFVPGTKHYSFPKAAALLGLGAANLRDIVVDTAARASIADLRAKLETCLAQRCPVIMVVSVIGSTEESAVDPIADVLALRDEMRARDLDFNVHADAAWGGYHAAVVRADFDLAQPSSFAAPGGPALPMTLSRYVKRQFEAIARADSVTIDPHKSGYIPYPAGALCYRNSAMRNLVSFSAPVVFHGGAEPTVGIYGVEGSKPGASVAAVYLAHRVIRPSQSGYGQIIGRALYSAKRLWARLVCMARPDDRFVVEPVAQIPRDVPGPTPEARVAYVREQIDARSNRELEVAMGQDLALAALLPELGPDQNIVAYAFNSRRGDGTRNSALALANQINTVMYRELSLKPLEDIYGHDMIVSTTDLSRETYGDAFFVAYAARLGITELNDDHITVLRSVVMDPWVTETADGWSFIDVLEKALRRAVAVALTDSRATSARGY